MTTPQPSVSTAGALPPVAADVAAGALDLLPARLRKRVDGATAKVAGWPVEAVPDGVRIRVDAETAVTLTLTDGVVARAADAVCGCLLAPACLHRAAVLSSAPLAEAVAEAPLPEAPLPDGASSDGASSDGASSDAAPANEAPAVSADPSGPAGATSRATASVTLTTAQSTALVALRTAATDVLVAGVTGSGAVHRAGLLHAAHSAKVAGLHLPAAAAVRIARRLGEARSQDPGFRLPELSAELAGLLELLRSPDEAVTPARRAYQPAKPLRLYGLFTEPVVTASGYAGAVGYGVSAEGVVHTVADVAPGVPERALQAAGTPVPGGCALPLRDWGDGGAVILTGPTVSPDGRVGGGSRIRSVTTAGARWHEPPLDGLWQRPAAEQLARALDWLASPPETRPAGGDLLHLTGVVAHGGFRVAGGPLLRLLAPDERAELPYAANVRLLASRPGLELRLIARVSADRPGSVAALAAAWRGHDGEPMRVDLGLRRLNRSHLPAETRQATPGPGPVGAHPALPVELDLLRRAVDRTVAGGRAVTAAADDELPRRLRAVGLSSGAECIRALAGAAAERRRDGLGRLLPADPDAFATAWLAASVYATAATRSLLPTLWSPTDSTDPTGPTSSAHSANSTNSTNPADMPDRTEQEGGRGGGMRAKENQSASSSV
ncbi:hypothetical protein ACH4E8_11035 [Streptomyces sp. NPDC017979]|uniref:hypothetical protein n=1 Tax=Streptomyces sp. NPDC017979 TaxID=3365024 RepID=UPI0037B240D0